MIRRLLRQRRTVPRRHAADALRKGRCVFAVNGGCEEIVNAVVRAADDADMVLVCRVHYGNLRRLRAYEAERIGRYLTATFADKLEPAPVRTLTTAKRVATR